jgi:hypothetical protein
MLVCVHYEGLKISLNTSRHKGFETCHNFCRLSIALKIGFQRKKNLNINNILLPAFYLRLNW